MSKRITILVVTVCVVAVACGVFVAFLRSGKKQKSMGSAYTESGALNASGLTSSDVGVRKKASNDLLMTYRLLESEVVTILEEGFARAEQAQEGPTSLELALAVAGGWRMSSTAKVIVDNLERVENEDEEGPGLGVITLKKIGRPASAAVMRRLVSTTDIEIRQMLAETLVYIEGKRISQALLEEERTKSRRPEIQGLLSEIIKSLD